MQGKELQQYVGILHTGNGKHHIETELLLQLQSPVSMWSFPFPVCSIPAYLLQFLPSVFIKKQTLDTDSEHKTQKRGGKKQKNKTQH